MNNIKHNDWIEKSNNDESICKSTAVLQYNNSNNISNSSKIIKIDKRCKVKNENFKRNWDLPIFLRINSINMVGKTNLLIIYYYIFQFLHASMGVLPKKYDSYNDNLKQGILTNNGRHDDIMALKWDCPDWCYVSRSKKGV